MKLEALKAQPVTKMSKVWWMQSLINDAVHAINFIIFYCVLLWMKIWISFHVLGAQERILNYFLSRYMDNMSSESHCEGGSWR